jgi:hypothetical protein
VNTRLIGGGSAVVIAESPWAQRLCMASCMLFAPGRTQPCRFSHDKIAPFASRLPKQFPDDAPIKVLGTIWQGYTYLSIVETTYFGGRTVPIQAAEQTTAKGAKEDPAEGEDARKGKTGERGFEPRLTDPESAPDQLLGVKNAVSGPMHVEVLVETHDRPLD